MSKGGAHIALGAAILFGGCTCRTKPQEPAGRIDGAIAATVREIDEGWHLGGGPWAKEDPTHASADPRAWETPSHRCELVVTKPKALTTVIGNYCFEGGRYTLVSDPEGKRLAFRPEKGDARWSVIYFGGDGRSFHPDLGKIAALAAPTIAWDAVPALDAVLEPLFRARPSPLVVDEVRATRGEKGLGDFLAATADTGGGYAHDYGEGPCTVGQRSPWSTGAMSLSAPETERLAAVLVPKLHDPKVEPVVLIRAVLLADLDAERLRDDVGAILDRSVYRKQEVAPQAFALLLLSLARHWPEHAARLGCYRLDYDYGSSTSTRPDHRAAFVAIGNAGFSCDAMKKVIAGNEWCKNVVLPGAGAKKAARVVLDRTAAERRAFLCENADAEKEIVGAAIEASEVANRDQPQRAIARLKYAVRMPDAPRCADLGPDKAGTPCSIEGGGDRVLYYLGCNALGSEVVLLSDITAKARIDDDAKALVVVRTDAPAAKR